MGLVGFELLEAVVRRGLLLAFELGPGRELLLLGELVLVVRRGLRFPSDTEEVDLWGDESRLGFPAGLAEPS